MPINRDTHRMPLASLLRLVLASAMLAPFGFAKPPRPVAQVPGQQADGAVLLPNQWLLRPAGKHVVVGDFPANIAMHPSGRWIAVLHCGYGPHEVITIDVAKNAV